jgi:hypothetical protein
LTSAAIAWAARIEQIQATIRSAVPPVIAEAIAIEANRRSRTTPTPLDEALQQAFGRYLTGEEANAT